MRQTCSCTLRRYVALSPSVCIMTSPALTPIQPNVALKSQRLSKFIQIAMLWSAYFGYPVEAQIVEAHRPTTDTDKRTNQPALVVLLHCVCTVQLTAYTRNSRTRQPRPTNSKQAYPEPNPSRVYIRGRGLDRRAFPLEPLQGALVLLHQRRHLLQNLLVVRVQPLFLLLI